MRTLVFAALVAVRALGPAMADDTCQSKAVGRTASLSPALLSNMTKCMKDTCEAKAIGKNGKTLAGAAKDSF